MANTVTTPAPINSLPQVSAPVPGDRLIVDNTDTSIPTRTIPAMVAVGGVTDHGFLEGLADDDHPHYLTQSRADSRYVQSSGLSSTLALYLLKTEAAATYVSIINANANYAPINDARFHSHANKAAIDRITEAAGLPLWDGAAWPGGGGGGGVTDHGALTGLGDDDHPQYLSKTEASSTYLTQASAASTYLTTSAAASTYLTQSAAGTTYLSKSEAASTYLTPAAAAALYYTEAESDAKYALLTDARFHAHSNKTTLDKITESAGAPLWNGSAWPGGSGGGGGGATLRASFDGQGDVVAAGTSVFIPVEAAGTIASATLVARVAGTVRVDLFSYSPTGGALGSGTAIGNISLSATQQARDTTLSGWTKALTAGQVLELRVAASPAPTVDWLTVSLGVT